MGGSFQILDLIFLALIAGFLVYRLRNVLGRRSGYEQTPEDLVNRKPEQDNVVDLAKARNGEAPAPAAFALPSGIEAGVATGLMRIQEEDQSFDPVMFLAGAQKAFEMIVCAFAEGRVDDLRPYLGDEVLANFATAVQEREAAGETAETQLISIKSAKITEAMMKGRDAVIAVEFITEQVNVVRNAEGEVVDGDSNFIATLTDVWTFAREVHAADPNWKLVVTR
ncbi:MAG: Tim44 domain-containing protein, partial [Rhodospirillaceae bacterium]|nr:Tim44 domain-containing protein [Rhodospirillaceae bacterium]